MVKFERELLKPMVIFFLAWGLASVLGQVPVEGKSNSRDCSTAPKFKQGRTGFELPAEWAAAWSDPTSELRPLQILHGIATRQATPAGMRALKELGLGGIVCNVDFDEYLVSEAHWETLIRGVEACRQVGLIVWIYDEDGYPSGAAGGLVLKRNPEFEALALTYAPSRAEPFTLRPAYEHTHASNNFYAARRYPNLIDEEAVRCFVETTHEGYWYRLKGHFGKTIQALFTDEPSLMAVNIGPLPDEVRKNVRVVDALDATVKPLPSVPWVRDLPMRYRQRYGEDIAAVQRSLFEGSSEVDRQVRRRFWALISDLIAERYFGQIQDWARAHQVASSGHTLWEETPLHHVPLEGNALKVLMRMDIPGLDILSSDPEAVIYSGWLTASLPASAALFNGGRQVMTEVSDFSQRMAKKGPASLADMQATAAWQAALGVTEFTLYYNRGEREARDFRVYCDFVGRLNALLREARPAPRVLLYYPIYDLWGEYMPVAEKLTLESQSKRMQQIVRSFLQLGQRMVRGQISFAVVDHELLAGAKVHDASPVRNSATGEHPGKEGLSNRAGMWIGRQRFSALVLPGGVELPKSAAEKVARFKSVGGQVFSEKGSGPGVDFKALATVCESGSLSVRTDRVVVGRFVRDGREILPVVNVAARPYIGGVAVKNGETWLVADPASGRIESAKTDEAGRVAVSLPSRSAVVLIGPPTKPETTAPGAPKSERWRLEKPSR